MSLTAEAVYENGVLKPAQPLPLKENEKVTITILPTKTGAETEPWTGEVKVVERSEEERERLAALGAELMRRAKESQPALEEAWDRLMAHWGISGEPIDIHELRARISQECGTSPEDNSFSRELIALREEGCS